MVLARSVIWDMDGVLLNTEPIYLAVEAKIISRYGKDINTVLPKLLGRRAHESAAIVLSELNIPLTVEQYLAERDEGLRKLMPYCQIFPGIEETIRHLKKNGIKNAIATSSTRNLLQVKSQGKDEFFNLFESIICGDDVQNGKPHPEIFLTAAEAIGTDPRECVVFEDAPAGLRAAATAGMMSVAIPNPKVDIALYNEENPTFTIPSGSILDFDLSLLGFPPLAA